MTHMALERNSVRDQKRVQKLLNRGSTPALQGVFYKLSLATLVSKLCKGTYEIAESMYGLNRYTVSLEIMNSI